VDVAEYRRKMRKEFTTKGGDVFTLRRVSAPRLIELFKQANVPVGKSTDDIPPEKSIEMAMSLLPDVVDELRPAGQSDDTHLGIDEVAMSDVVDLFVEVMKMSGVSEEAIAKAKAFREPPPGEVGGDSGPGVPGGGAPH
jgi:hypothetical protein